MANFSLEDVKALRERLGTGMVDTKNALVEADGDIEKAVEILRLKGAKGNAKRADRSTSEGLVRVVESATAATMFELACETDFVSKNEKFIALADRIAEALADSGAEDVDAALAVKAGSGTVASIIDDEAAIIGEKVELRRLVRLMEIITGGRRDSPENRWKSESRWRRDREEIGWQLMVMIATIVCVIALVVASEAWLHALQAAPARHRP